MNFIKGMIIGLAIGAASSSMCSQGMINKKKFIKEGKKIAKKIGII